MESTGILSVYLLAAALGWLSSQVIKYLVQATKARSWRNISLFYKSGNMPSVHTATVSALATSIGLWDGVNSALFVVSLVLGTIVAYDAMQVRRSVGEQGRALAKLIESKSKSAKLPYYSSGHRPIEVLVGAILGIASGAVVVIYVTYFSL